MWLWMPRLIMQERDGSETSEGKLPRQALGFVNRANPSDTAATQLCAHNPALFFTSGAHKGPSSYWLHILQCFKPA